MKQVSELTREQLERIVVEIRDILWREPATGRLDPDRSWTVETTEWVSGVIEDAGLKPDPLPPARPEPEDLAVAIRAALEAFVVTIEATGGCVRPGPVADGPQGEEVAAFEDDRPVPAADETWLDLADAYLRACRALGREPMVRGADDDERPGEGAEAHPDRTIVAPGG
jgi:hypothetical protein